MIHGRQNTRSHLHGQWRRRSRPSFANRKLLTSGVPGRSARGGLHRISRPLRRVATRVPCEGMLLLPVVDRCPAKTFTASFRQRRGQFRIVVMNRGEVKDIA